MKQSDYSRLERVIQYMRVHKKLPADFQSFEYRRSNYTCTLDATELAKQRKRFHEELHGQTLRASRDGQQAPRIAILLVEGFLLYYSVAVRKLLDVRLFLRISRATMHQRRMERANYVLDDGEVWEDPPFYFDEIVWPAYMEASSHMFENGDVERGAPIVPSGHGFISQDGGPLRDLQVLEVEHCTKKQVTLAATNHIHAFLTK